MSTMDALYRISEDLKLDVSIFIKIKMGLKLNMSMLFSDYNLFT